MGKLTTLSFIFWYIGNFLLFSPRKQIECNIFQLSVGYITRNYRKLQEYMIHTFSHSFQFWPIFPEMGCSWKYKNITNFPLTSQDGHYVSDTVFLCTSVLYHMNMNQYNYAIAPMPYWDHSEENVYIRNLDTYLCCIHIYLICILEVQWG